MNHKIMRMTGILLAVAAAAAVLALGINWAQAEGAAAPVQAAAAQTGTAFTYQGRLVYNGTAVNGACDLTFRLYDSAGNGANQIGLNQNKPNVSVNDGLFTVDLDFGDGAFSGDARYLQIAINSCTNGASSVTLPLIELTAAPYALGLRPGAVIKGAVSGSSVISATNNAASGRAYGVYGQSDSADPNGAGVYGWATAASEATKGVYGQTDSNGYAASGVFGFASATNGEVYGAFGQTFSNEGAGVYGLGTMTGTVGYANSSSGTTYGVYGKANSPNGYGIYSQGNAHVEGQLTWKPITSYLSIPAAAFTPYKNDHVYTNDGHTLTPGNSSSASYLAPVQLPQGATVTDFTFYWTDCSNDNGYARLYRIDLAGNEISMVSPVSTSGGSSGGGGGSCSTSSSNSTAISPAGIDNERYAYYVWLNLPTDTNGATVKAHGVVIEYTIDRPY